jgi:galactose mutarotase-like enzyme
MNKSQTVIYSGTYKGMDSIVSENAALRAEVIPELGGKIVSLIYKPTGKEWMIGSGRRPLKQPVYGTSFTEWDMSGWDECFPTIDPCMTGEKGDILLPDHGELWSQPWESLAKEGKVLCSVQGRRLSYRFSRELELKDNATLRLNYEVKNIGDAPLPCLWTAHPQFTIDEPTDIVLPKAMRDLICVFGGRKYETGASFRAPENWTISTDVVGDGRKFYYPKPVSEAWSGLYGRNSGNYLVLKTNRAKVPYWGVWIDEGMCNDRTTVALEPGIGYYDSLERAVRNGTAMLLTPGETSCWHLEIELGCRVGGTA